MTFAIRQHRLPVRTQRRSISSYAADFLAFLIGATITYNLRLVGDLPVAEAILFFLLPFLLAFHPRRASSPLLKMVYLFLGLWLFGQVMSDIYHETRAVNWMRGDAEIIFFAIDIACLAVLLVGNDLRKVLFLSGFAAGSFASTTYHLGVLNEPWKFGYAMPTILTVLIISSHFYGRQKFITSGLLLAGIIVVNLVLNYRSPVLILLIVVALVFPVVPERIGGMRILPRPGNAMRIVVLAGFVMGAAWLSQTLVVYVTASGFLSEEAKEKNEEQAKGGNLLLGGRSEVLVSSRAVMESPIVGHGSWATDRRYTEMLFDLRAERGESQEPVENWAGDIPAHSHLMGAWVWAGILGAVFWFYILWLTIKAIVRASVLRQPTAPLYLWILGNFFWDILFSPFGNWQRIYGGIAIILILDLLEHRVPAIHKVTLSSWTGKRYLSEPWGTSRPTRLSRLGAWRRPVPLKRNWRGVRGL